MGGIDRTLTREPPRHVPGLLCTNTTVLDSTYVKLTVKCQLPAVHLGLCVAVLRTNPRQEIRWDLR